jgi:hypothetical protein
LGTYVTERKGRSLAKTHAVTLKNMSG